jgi:hypothetical protein
MSKTFLERTRCADIWFTLVVINRRTKLTSKAYNVWTSLSLILCNFRNTHKSSTVYEMMATIIRNTGVEGTLILAGWIWAPFHNELESATGTATTRQSLNQI